MLSFNNRFVSHAARAHWVSAEVLCWVMLSARKGTDLQGQSALLCGIRTEWPLNLP